MRSNALCFIRMSAWHVLRADLYQRLRGDFEPIDRFTVGSICEVIRVFMEAGLPEGVVTAVNGLGPVS